MSQRIHRAARPRARRLLALFAAALSACGGTQQSNNTVAMTQPPPPRPVEQPTPVEPSRTPNADFRRQAPAPGETPAFVAPRIEDFRLANGMRVLLVERHELPIVVARFVTRRGADDAPLNRPGMASFTGQMLELGTTRRTSLQLSDEFAAIGADHGTGVDWDSGNAFVKVLSSNLEPALDLLADIVQNPAFSPEELERSRGRRLTTLRQETDVPAMVASNTAARAVYGEAHPYGRSLNGTAPAITAMTRAEILRYYRAHFVPSDSALVIIGDATRAALQPTLDRLFGRWTPRGPAVRPVPAAPAMRPTPRVVMVDRPGTPQAAVVIAHPGVARTATDYPAVLVMNTILGGMFSSRINLNLRERNAFTYGARSTYSFRRGVGPFGAGGPIQTPHTGAAIRELFSEINRMRTTDVTAEELAAAQSRIIDTLPSRFEGGDQTSAAIAELFVYNLPLDEWATLPARIRAVTAADIRRAAEQHLDPEHARVVIVGDRQAIEPTLAPLNLGAIEQRTPTGELVAAAAGSARAPGSAAAPPAQQPNAQQPNAQQPNAQQPNAQH